MITTTTILEDTVIHATRNAIGMWVGNCTDSSMSKVARINWTDSQMGAVLLIAVSDDDGDGELWKIAQDAVKDLPPECRPIP